MAIITELQKVTPFGRIQNREPPIVEDQELNAAEGLDHIATSDAGLQRFRTGGLDRGQAVIEHRA